MKNVLEQAAEVIRSSQLRIEDTQYQWPALLALLLLGRDAEARESELVRGGMDPGQAEAVAYGAPLVLPPAARRSVITRAGLNAGQALVDSYEALTVANPSSAQLFAPLTELAKSAPTDVALSIAMLNTVVNTATDSSFETMRTFIEGMAADASPRSSGVAAAPGIGEAMVRLADLRPGAVVGDFYCGNGALLAEALRAGPSEVRGTGQEVNAQAANLAALTGLFAREGALEVEHGDPLMSPMTDGPGLRRFDRIVSVPPVSWKLSSTQVSRLEHDPHMRFRYGPGLHRNARELAYAQHCLAALTPGGRAVLLVAVGLLFRAGTEGEIRRALIQDDKLEAVIALPPGMMANTMISTAILVLAADKPPERRGQTMFVVVPDAAGNRDDGLNRNAADRVVAAVSSWKAEPGFARIVSLADMAEQDFDLQPARFIDDFEPPPTVDWPARLSELADLEHQRDEAERRVDELLRTDFNL